MDEAQPPFDIIYDPNTERLRASMRGFWTLQTAADYELAQTALIKTLARGGPYDTIIDSREFPVQSREVSEALGEVDSRAWRINPGRVAVVVSTMMNKLQAERVLAVDKARVFLSINDAEHWLDHPSDHEVGK